MVFFKHAATVLAHFGETSRVANDIAQTYHGLMLAIPEDAWRVFSRMRPAAMVTTLRE